MLVQATSKLFFLLILPRIKIKAFLISLRKQLKTIKSFYREKSLLVTTLSSQGLQIKNVFSKYNFKNQMKYIFIFNFIYNSIFRSKHLLVAITAH